MALIKCEGCGKEISDKAKVCIHCDTPIQSKKEKRVIINDYETEQNINSLNKLSIISCVALIIMGIIVFLIGLSLENDFATPSLIITAIVFIIIGLILPIFIKWMALMLKNIYELNRKGGN